MFTSEKLHLALQKFSKALRRLEEAATAPLSPLQSDAALQRFEFTFELCWKAARVYLSEEAGVEVSSPKGTLKAAFRQELLPASEETQFDQMLSDRNASTHAYDEQEANEIFGRVRDSHLPAMKALLARLQTEGSRQPRIYPTQ